jgi:hypothetical protein
MVERVVCDACGVSVPPHAHFVVRIDVFADPSLPAMTTEQLEEISAEQTFKDLIEQMKSMSADELMDGVHRRFEYRLCAECQKRFLANPLGLPRVKRMGEN